MVLALLGAGTVAALLNNDDDPAPIPSDDQLRADGFAIWPEDTLDEGIRACDQAEEWQLEPQETAFRFAREVLNYPEPHLNTVPIADEESTRTDVRYLIGSRGVPGVFLGSVVDVRKYGRCWFVVRVDPREGGWLPSVAFAHNGDRTQLVLQTLGSEVEIGYGSWEKTITDDRDQVVLDLPDLEPDATGHLMALGPYRQVLDGSAAPLGFIPDPATATVRRLTREEVLKARRVCRRDDAYRSPQAALADLYTFTLDRPVSTSGRQIIFKGDDGAEHVRGERWSLAVGQAQVNVLVPQIKPGCWRVLFINDHRRHHLLQLLRVEPDWLTFDLNWGNATSGTLTVSTSQGGSSWTFNKLDQPLTVRNYESWLLDEPIEVTVVLRAGRDVISAERTWQLPE